MANDNNQLQTLVLKSVADVAAAIENAKHVDEVILALYSLALCLFPFDSQNPRPFLTGESDEGRRNQASELVLPSDAERNCWRQALYSGAAFPVLSQILLGNVAANWLASFPSSARKQVYDPFFVWGPQTEVLMVLVPSLKHDGDASVCSNVERLLILCFIKNEGIRQIVREFGLKSSEHSGMSKLDKASKAAQLLASIPDKARLKASSALSAHLFFQQATNQLLAGAAETAIELGSKCDDATSNILDSSFLFVGETFSRICRRGSAGILLGKMIPMILDHLRSFLSSHDASISLIALERDPRSRFWFFIIETMSDQYAVERLSEELLRQLATQNIDNTEAYWTLWLLFHRTIEHNIAIRAMFVDKFLFWKVFPLCCLRWILQFAVFGGPQNCFTRVEGQKTSTFLDVAHQLFTLWSRREFVQSASLEQQAYVTAAVGLCIEAMSKPDLETTKDLLHSILQGVSSRLESPDHLVRKMASSIALAFSKVVDPKNPLFLDDDCSETIDWEFGLLSQTKTVALTNEARRNGSKVHYPSDNISENKPRRSDEGMDHSMHGIETFPQEGDIDDEDWKSDVSSDSSLQPYDLADDDSDLKSKFSQLGDIAVALRKADDPDSVERALDVAEKFVRASPDELRHISGDLVRALVHVRCSDVAVEGEEDSAEGKRQRALVALLVTCPFESLDVITKLLYSPNVDVSQRILILDVMTEAAQELSESKVMRAKRQEGSLISCISGQPWFIPNSRGPPGAGSWKEISEPGSSVSWSHRYEREIPSKPGQIKSGKSRRWGLAKAKDPHLESSKNRFPLYAAAFMLPVMQGFDIRRQGVDLLHRDFIVLGKLIYMLGVCMKCTTMHPEASALAPALLDMLRSRAVSQHAEAYVRRSVLFATSCLLSALHPSHVASALIQGNEELSSGLEWIRTWALHISESDPDTECSSMAMACLQLHAEMALQASRALEYAESQKSISNTLTTKLDEIILPPFSSLRY